MFCFVHFQCTGRYKKKNIKELQKVLHKCNEQLKQFSHVNKKALDQYMNFIEQREQLQKRRAELDAGDQVLPVCGRTRYHPKKL